MKLMDMLFKILSVLVIPLLLWGISLEVRLAVQKTEMAQMKQDLAATENVKAAVQAGALALVRLEEQIHAINTNLTEIKGLLPR